ncbi:DUF4845 domain-containing protein [Salinisphaera sp. Q1T1-3]|uniref:DUF4845 domain-containing protein n=1 Tax=Salinisphaera sp. Q1T1-3 TaxID=2321229 RepID=UPI000E7588CE|nr:DUF4845 domain-containing protein [Salinisphaera sp. Q1T1-3]RJS92051.1 DUF4845 domain-containing protein [Salinisphaera sp. Q1T1-3]
MAYPVRQTTSRQEQTGASLLSMLYVLITLGIAVMIAFRAVPVYLQNREVAGALEAVAADPELQSSAPIAIQRALSRRLSARYASGVTADDVEITTDGTQRVLHLSYDVRRPLIGNMGLVFHFDDRAVMGGGGG